MSNAFEIWLLCHYKTTGEIDPNPAMYNKPIINKVLNDYKLSGINERDFCPLTDRAVETAEKLDSNPKDRWTQNTGTRVYRLIKNLKALIRE